MFTEISGVEPSTFGFAVVVHPRDPDRAWFVPQIKDEKRIPSGGKLVVTRTRDGGKNFDVLTAGLPQSHAYDVVYRHALALDRSGDRLAFGPRQEAFGSARIRVTVGHALRTRCPPCTPCGSRNELVSEDHVR